MEATGRDSHGSKHMGNSRGNSGGIHGINVGFKHVLTGWWFGTWLLFFHILGIIIPTDFHIFQRG